MPNILLKISVYEFGKNSDFINFFIFKGLQAQTKFRFRFQVFYVQYDISRSTANLVQAFLSRFPETLISTNSTSTIFNHHDFMGRFQFFITFDGYFFISPVNPEIFFGLAYVSNSLFQLFEGRYSWQRETTQIFLLGTLVEDFISDLFVWKFRHFEF